MAAARSADIVVIGGGIAGAGAAYELAATKSVILLERESACGVHATGRSAASFTENYGNAVVRRLAMASRAFLERPDDFTDVPLMRPRGMLTIARIDQLDSLAAELDRARLLVPSIERMTADQALDRVPLLRRDYVAGAILEPDSRELDVDALHQGFLRGARRRGAQIVTGADVRSLEYRDDTWTVVTANGTWTTGIVVNAAGAWADVIADMAGLPRLGLMPKRRTAFHVAAPDGVSIAGWPLVNDVDEQFYFKPDAGRIFVSPGDATPSEPMDAWPDDLDVAIGVERLQKAAAIEVRTIASSWAGLRTFAPDNTPVVGFDDRAAGFFWLAGQGGYGIKTSPALSRACAALIVEGRLPDDLLRLGVEPNTLSPSRLTASVLKEPLE